MSPTIPIKQINRNQIYRYIYKHTKVSQQDISSDLKLSMPTINQNLNALRSMGLISDQDTFESTGGRKARAISCVKDARISIGLDITANHVSLVAIDMYANILHYNRIRHRYTDSFYYYATLGKLTWPSCVGEAQTRAEAAEHIAEAVKALAIYEEKANFLKGLAQSTLTRVQ